MSGAAAASGPVPASKTHRDENFPVGSRLLRAAHRPHVLAFYRFARAADDVADAPDLSAQDKLARLGAMEAALGGDGDDPRAAALRATQGETGCGVAEARALLAAFRQDAVKARYESWDDLAAYCRLSAEPVGRFLLALHGEGTEAYAASDGLCTALQVLNHIQDCADDRTTLRRIYIPAPWIALAGGEAAFFAPKAVAARRPTLDALLDRVDDALDRAADLPALVRDARLGMEAGVTLSLARRLARRLREADPVAARVALTPADVRPRRRDRARLALRAHHAGRGPCGRAHPRRSRPQLFRGRHAHPAARAPPPAVHAIYAFARAVDDVADAPTPPEERLERLKVWRAAVERLREGRPVGPLERELDRAARRYALPLEELDRLIDGMAGDCESQVRLATPAGLRPLCPPRRRHGRRLERTRLRPLRGAGDAGHRPPLRPHARRGAAGHQRAARREGGCRRGARLRAARGPGDPRRERPREPAPCPRPATPWPPTPAAGSPRPARLASRSTPAPCAPPS